jgi:hypothetical protein
MRRSTNLGVSILWAAAILGTALLIKDSAHAFAEIMLLSVCSSTSVLLMNRACRANKACAGV